MKKKLDLEKIAVEHWDKQQKGEDRREIWNLGSRIEKLEQFKRQTEEELKRQYRQIGLIFHEIEKIVEALNEA